MSQEVNAAYIKNVRAKYGLTQKAFARILGIGEASIIRYEQGQKPTKAMANLIRAAAMPEFMADCLERDGDLLTAAQKENAERVVYSMVTFDEKGDVMDINDMYELTLQQEVLNEQAALIIADVTRDLADAREHNDVLREAVCRDVLKELASLKPRIVWKEYRNHVKQAELRGMFNSLANVAAHHVGQVA